MLTEEFSERLLHGLQQKLLKDITQATSLVDTNYHERFKLPTDLVREVYASLDHDRIVARCRELLEETLAQKIVNSLVTETTNDVKQLLSNAQLRAQLREQVLPAVFKLVRAYESP